MASMTGRVKSVAKGCLLTMLLLFGVPFVFFMIMFGDASNACWEDSEAVARARELSAERLSVLYRDMKIYATADGTPIEGYSRFSDGGDHAIPAEFADLDAVRVRPKLANIMLQGCLDAGVDLEFEGLTDSAKPARVILVWGDHHESGQQILWQE
jgi:hypothetical protein